MTTRVLIIKTGALGDVVRTTCLIPALERLFRRLELTWVTSRPAWPLVAWHPGVARVAAMDDADSAPWRGRFYDWVISLDDDAECCELATSLRAGRLSGGYMNAQGLRAYTSDSAPWFGMGLLRPENEGGLEEANRRKRGNRSTFGALLYKGLGLPPPVRPPSVHIPATAVRTATEWLNSAVGPAGSFIVGVNTGASPRWRHKAWGIHQAAQLATRLADDMNATVLILGGTAEAERNRAIVAAAGCERVVGAPPELDLLTFAALLSHCDVVVSSDSLAMHLAVAASRPVVALFGPTSDAEIDVGDRGVKLVTDLPCRRCYLHDCVVRPTCMDVITPDMVYKAICELRARLAPGTRLRAAALP